MPTNILTIEIIGTPLQKNRARSGKGRVYSDQKEEAATRMMLIQAQLSRSKHIFPIPAKIPVSIDAQYIFPLPKQASKKLIKRIEAGEIIEHVVTPDKDNLDKMINDCMNGRVYHDDAQVWEVNGRKYYGLQPKTIITISWRTLT